jgi:hypothetical protein
MINLSWLAEIVFFGSYFIAWVTNEIPHTTWLNVSAIAAIVVVVCLLLFNGYPYLNRQHPQA